MGRLSNGFEIDIPTNVFFGAVLGGIVLAALAVLTAIVVRMVRTWQPEHQLRAVNDLSRKMNLIVPDELREPLAHAVAVRKRGAEVASLVGMVCVGLAWWLVFDPFSDSPDGINFAAILLIIAAPGIFTTIGAAIGGLLSRRETAGKARTARLTPLTYRDLVAPVEQHFLIISVACAVVFSALLMAASLAPWTDATFVSKAEAPVFLGAGLAVGLLWLALPRISSKLASTRALAGDEHALAWSDALAARITRDLTHFAMTAGALTAIFSISALGFTLPPEWSGVGAWFPNLGIIIGAAGLITGGVIVGGREPDIHVQRTLWPQFAANGR